MKIAAITRFKQGDIFNVLCRLRMTQASLARVTGISQTIIGLIVNMKRRPSADQAAKIQNVFGERGEFIDILALWPEQFRLKEAAVICQTKEVPDEALLAYDTQLTLQDAAPPIPGTIESTIDLDVLVEGLTDERDREVIERHYGLRDGKPESIAHIATRFNVGVSRMHQIKGRAIRKMRMKLAKDE